MITMVTMVTSTLRFDSDFLFDKLELVVNNLKKLGSLLNQTIFYAPYGPHG